MLTEAQKNNQNLLVQAQRYQSAVMLARFAEQSLKSLTNSDLDFFLQDDEDSFAAAKLYQAIEVLEKIKAKTVFGKLSSQLM